MHARAGDAVSPRSESSRPVSEIALGDGAIGRAAATGERLIPPGGGSLTAMVGARP
jgi:hypothetical protein